MCEGGLCIFVREVSFCLSNAVGFVCKSGFCVWVDVVSIVRSAWSPFSLSGCAVSVVVGKDGCCLHIVILSVFI